MHNFSLVTMLMLGAKTLDVKVWVIFVNKWEW